MLAGSRKRAKVVPRPPEGIMGTEPPYRVRVTDINGSVLEAPVELAPGAQDTGLQFECN